MGMKYRNTVILRGLTTTGITCPPLCAAYSWATGVDIIQLGVVLLIATPIARILFSVFAFTVEKDYLYIVITLIVLGVILFSMLGGLGG